MLEVMMILCFVQYFTLSAYKGKTIETLSEKQKLKFEKQFNFYKKSKKADPNMTEQGYMELLTKQAQTYLTMGFVLIPIYIFIVFTYYV